MPSARAEAVGAVAIITHGAPEPQEVQSAAARGEFVSERIESVAVGDGTGDATSLAQSIIEWMSAPYDIDGHEASVGASIGIAVSPGDGETPEKLLRNADLALYRAKGDGRGTFRFFEPVMDLQMQTRRVMEQDLRKALPAGVTPARKTPTGQLSVLPSRPQYGRATPTRAVPFLGKPELSKTPTVPIDHVAAEGRRASAKTCWISRGTSW